MKMLEINSHKLLLEKAIDPLSELNIEELKRIEGLDVKGFSEADVRAEIIDPVLRILGYQKGQDYSVDREKYIRFLGKPESEKNKTGITKKYIDYNLTLWKKNFWLIEAKKPMPQKSEFGYDELSQAVEYAIHPKIEAALVVLCDGLKLEVFDREQNLEEPLLRIAISNLVNTFENLQKLLCPMQIWFFYRRRIIRAIDRAFENEGNQNRVNEFKQIVESRLDQKRSQILDNFRNMKLSETNKYEDHLSKTMKDEIIDVHFFIGQSNPCITAMVKNLLATCKKERTTFKVLYHVFPELPRDANDYFYMHALEFLIKIEEEKLNADWLPKWLRVDDKINTNKAIELLIERCLTHFSKDEDRKIILLAANTFRRIYKIFAVIIPYQKQIAEIEHIITRYSHTEFCWEQILSCRERNVILGLDRLSVLSTAEFVRKFSKKDNQIFNKHLAKQDLKEMWNFEYTILKTFPSYFQLLKECNFNEIHPTEESGVRYDNLGHNCLCIIGNHEKWKNYILNNHLIEVETLSNIGSWAARKLLKENNIKSSSSNKIDYHQLLVDRFFFGDKEMFEKILTVYYKT
ncbi:MAG: hypothetical protein GY795_21050 [Desulfobacterales bacterium]|nr:hypothetical protein [Desulfobacterales bacterium]